MRKPESISLAEMSAVAGAKNVLPKPLETKRKRYIEREGKKPSGFVGDTMEEIRVDLARLEIAELAGPEAVDEFYASQHKLVLTY